MTTTSDHHICVDYPRNHTASQSHHALNRKESAAPALARTDTTTHH